MSAEAKMRQVILSPEELQDIKRSPLGAEVLFWVMEVHAEKASHFEATRISMAEAVFKKTAEERPDRHGVVIPGCCHTCGGNLRTHHRGHDDSKGEAYEGRKGRHATSWKSSRQQVHARSVLTWRGTSEGNTKVRQVCWQGWRRVCPLATWRKNCPL